MAKKFRDLLAEKPASWHAAVEARTRELLAAKPSRTYEARIETPGQTSEITDGPDGKPVPGEH
ncbi:MAG TPA: hypothetical protein VHQ90_17645 [Thermoanaerobaculia bacterium]|nr:hypothetical protein [Thermoanaerobaculia bacterium]